MEPTLQPSVRFGQFEVLLAQRQLRSHGQVVPVGARAFDLLVALIEHCDRVVTKDELLDLVWPGAFVEQANVQVQVSILRRLLGHRSIVTVAGRGYRFAEPLSKGGGLEPASAAVPQSPDSRRVAVLPFRGRGSDPGCEELARGISFDLVAELARNSDLRVVSHHSAFSALTDSAPLAEIGRRLRTRYVVDGTVERLGVSLSIQIELIDTVDDRLVWVSQHTTTSMEFPKIRDALLRRIGGTVHSRTIDTEVRRVLSRPVEDLNVYALVWRGAALLMQFDAGSIDEGRRVLEQAIGLESRHAPAWAWLGLLNAIDSMLWITGTWHPGRHNEFVAQISRALALDPDNATACRALSLAHRMARNFEAAMAAAMRSVEVAPSSAQSLQALSEVQCATGQSAAALATIESALDLHPLPPAWVCLGHANALWANGRLEEALEAVDSGLAKWPNYWPAQVLRMYVLFEMGRFESAREEVLSVLARLPRLTTTALLGFWSDEATELRARTLAAALGSGVPAGSGYRS